MDDASTRGRTGDLLAMLTRALHYLNSGLDPRHQICCDLDPIVGSTASVYVVRRPTGVPEVSPPSGPLESSLVDRALQLLPVRDRPFPCGHSQPGTCVPLGRTPGRSSAVVLGGWPLDPLALEEAGLVLWEVDALLDGLRPPTRPSSVVLTPRELEVLQLLAEGLLARTIAVRLSLSPRTVHHHLGSIYDKLGVRDRLAAVLRAREQGVLPDRHPTTPDPTRRSPVRSPALGS